jgi:hypothetical protein
MGGLRPAKDKEKKSKGKEMENRDSDPLHRKIPVITVCIEDPYYTF